MTTRAQVKINGTYDTITSADPTAAESAPAYTNGHRWLATGSGDSFELTDETAGTWMQIETALDAKIDTVLASTYKRVLTECYGSLAIQRQAELEEAPDSIAWNSLWWLNTYVSVYADWTISGASISVADADDIVGSVDDFEYEDAAYIIGSRRNDGVHTVESVDAAGLTFGETLIDGDSQFVVMLISVPTDLDLIIARMIYYDIQIRPLRYGLQSERIGSYSYQTSEQMIGGLRYPIDVIAGIDSYLGNGPIADARFTP